MSIVEAFRELDSLKDQSVRVLELQAELAEVMDEVGYWRGECEKARGRVERLESELASAKAAAPQRGW